ncbi:MAG: HPr family phosphocarrier protein [Oscillospiraceae bacterium]|jgi:phosphocarrier protein|nr:HPr family phosphocarrier protein [Oscillospiraceae bacterium]
MFEEEAIVKNNLGLFARPAMFFIQKANEFKSTIFIKFNEKMVNAKSLLGVLSLGVMKGQKIVISAEGIDDREAVSSLIRLIDSCFLEYETTDEDV